MKLVLDSRLVAHAALSTSALGALAVRIVAPFCLSFLGLAAFAHVSAAAFSCAGTIRVGAFFFRHD